MSRAVVPVVYTAKGVPGVNLDVYVDPIGWCKTNHDGYTIDPRTNQAPVVPDGLPYFVLVGQDYAIGINGHGSPLKPNVNIPTTGGCELIIGDQGRPLQPNQVQCPPLHVVIGWSIGPYGFLLNGAPVLWKNSRFFTGYKRHLDGTLDDAALQQLSLLGANLVRVFLNWGLIDFDVSHYGDRFWSEAPVFLQRLARFGLSAQCVMVSPKPLAPSVDTWPKMADFANRWYAAVNGQTNWIVEKVNEPEQSLGSQAKDFCNAIPTPPAGILWSTGLMSYWALDVGGTHATFTGGRSGHHIINDCVPTEAIEATGKPWINNEVTRADQYGFDRQTASRIARAGAVWYGVGFDSQQGSDALLLTGDTLACAQSHFGSFL